MMELLLKEFDKSLAAVSDLLELSPKQMELLCKDEDEMKNLYKDNYLKKKIRDLKEKREFESHTLVIPDMKIRSVPKANFQSLTRLPDFTSQLGGHVCQDKSAVPDLHGLSAREWASVFYHCGCGTGVIVGGDSRIPLKKKPTDNIIEIPNTFLLPYFQAEQVTDKLEVKITQHESLIEAHKTCDFHEEYKFASPIVSANISKSYSYSETNINRNQSYSCVAVYEFPVGDFILAPHNICTHYQPCGLEKCIPKFKVNQDFVNEVKSVIEEKGDKLRPTDFNKIIDRFGDMIPTRVTIGLAATGTTIKKFSYANTKTEASHQMQSDISAQFCAVSGGSGVRNETKTSSANSNQGSSENISWTTIGGGVMTSTSEPRSLVQNRYNPHLWRVIHTANFISFKELLPDDLRLIMNVAEAVLLPSEKEKSLTIIKELFDRADKLEIGGHEGMKKNGAPHGLGIMKINVSNSSYTPEASYIGNSPLTAVYIGNFENGSPKGKGKYAFSDGYDFDEQWKSEKRNGQGKFTYWDGSVYQGDWKDGKKCGKGTMIYSNVEIYEGDWKDDLRNGKGKYTYSNGNVYKGDYKDDKKDGEGILYYKHDTYIGQWKYDKRNGKGVFYKFGSSNAEQVYMDDRIISGPNFS